MDREGGKEKMRECNQGRKKQKWSKTNHRAGGPENEARDFLQTEISNLLVIDCNDFVARLGMDTCA